MVCIFWYPGKKNPLEYIEAGENLYKFLISIMNQNSFSSNNQPACPKYVLIVDVETTGLETQNSQVIEVAAILYSVKDKSIVQQFSTVLPAQANDAERINRIKASLLQEIKEDSITIAVWVLQEMAKKAQAIVAHNAEFDKQWFGHLDDTKNALPILLNLSDEPLPWLCTCNDFNWPNQTHPGQSLINLAVAHDVGVARVHRAMADCELIAALFDRMENLEAMFEEALRPKALFKANVTYEERELAKKAGFKWIPKLKSWTRKMSTDDIKMLPFSVTQIAAF